MPVDAYLVDVALPAGRKRPANVIVFEVRLCAATPADPGRRRSWALVRAPIRGNDRIGPTVANPPRVPEERRNHQRDQRQHRGERTEITGRRHLLIVACPHKRRRLVPRRGHGRSTSSGGHDERGDARSGGPGATAQNPRPAGHALLWGFSMRILLPCGGDVAKGWSLGGLGGCRCAGDSKDVERDRRELVRHG
jgi:hypothetical protein